MSRDGQLISNRRSQFVPIDKTDLIIGKVQGHPDGFGFVLCDDADDVHLSMRQMSKVFHGDRVAVRIIGYDRRNRPEGRIEKVLERNTQTVVGRFYDQDRKSTRLNSSHVRISYAVFCLKKKKKKQQ